MGIVLPDSILGSPGLGYIREWLIHNHRIVASIDLHADTFQPRNGTQTSVLFLQKKTQEQKDKEEKSGLYHYRRRHQLSQRKLNIPRMSIMKLAGILSMSLFSLCGLEISEAELMELSRIETGKKSEIEGELVNYKFDSSENERKHVTYEYEKKYYDAIKRGDSDYFKGPMYDKLHLYDEIGKLAEGGLKQAEYMVAAGLALISRAAMFTRIADRSLCGERCVLSKAGKV